MIKITFKDGNEKEFENGITLAKIAESISKTLRKSVIAGYVNGELYDLNREIEVDATINLLTLEDNESEDILNHSCAHLLAQAITRLYPGTKFGIGPSIENGFYYDVETPTPILEEDLKKIEKEMQKIVAAAFPVTRMVVTKEEALERFKNDEYKTELISELNDDVITIYEQENFADLCRGVHVENTKVVKNFKLLSLAGAYWRGNSDNVMLQRVYGVAKPSKEALDNYLFMLEEAKKRDHRKLGKELDLFFISEYGPGFPFFLPKGMIVKNELINYWTEVHKREKYDFIQTPIMLNKELWETSGHWFNYRENMYTSDIDKHEFAIKPMNCPGGILVYQNDIHSYKEFPIKSGELGVVHRHEASGALHGLFRVRVFTQDDAHVFCREDQIEQEVIKLIKLYDEMYSKFGLKFHIELSTMPENAIGTKEIWDLSEKALAKACEVGGYDYVINEGDGAFYGPKLDFKLHDSIGRTWQCGTIQLDWNLPERFDMTYIAEDGTKKRPAMIHRALLGSLERFLGILTEHYAGAFPTWMAPEQVRIIPVNLELHGERANEINEILFDSKVRSSVDDRDEKMNKKIRESQINKVRYSIIIGDEEIANETVTVRAYGSQENATMSLEEFKTNILEEISTRR